MPKALIVEDEPLMREYLWRNLDRIHNAWKATACAKDGLEAIEILRHHTFDLVITDIRMPRCDGLELASYINDNCPGTAVVILSGHDEFEYARSALQKGVSDYLLKPLDDKALNALLDRLASNKKLSVDEGDEEPVVQDRDSESPSLLIERARMFIKENYTRPLALNDVAQALDVSPSYLSSVFKSDKGETYTKYILRLRMERAAKLLVSYKAGKVGDIAQEAGFTSTKYFDSAEYRQSGSGS